MIKENQAKLKALAPFKADLLEGAKTALPIVVGYVPVAISYGVLAMQAGFTLWHTMGMSLFVYAGASQFMAVSMYGMGAAALEMITATLLINFRHFILSLSLMSRLREIPTGKKAILSYWLTDETFAVGAVKADEAMADPPRKGRKGGEKGPLSAAYLVGLFLPPYIFWNVGSFLGALLSMVIPPSIGESMAIALYAMFIGLLVPALGKGWAIGAIAGLGALLATLFVHLFHFNSGWAIVLATTLASIPAMFWLKEEE